MAFTNTQRINLDVQKYIIASNPAEFTATAAPPKFLVLAQPEDATVLGSVGFVTLEDELGANPSNRVFTAKVRILLKDASQDNLYGAANSIWELFHPSGDLTGFTFASGMYCLAAQNTRRAGLPNEAVAPNRFQVEVRVDLQLQGNDFIPPP